MAPGHGPGGPFNPGNRLKSLKGTGRGGVQFRNTQTTQCNYSRQSKLHSSGQSQTATSTSRCFTCLAACTLEVASSRCYLPDRVKYGLRMLDLPASCLLIIRILLQAIALTTFKGHVAVKQTVGKFLLTLVFWFTQPVRELFAHPRSMTTIVGSQSSGPYARRCALPSGPRQPRPPAAASSRWSRTRYRLSVSTQRIFHYRMIPLFRSASRQKAS